MIGAELVFVVGLAVGAWLVRGPRPRPVVNYLVRTEYVVTGNETRH